MYVGLLLIYVGVTGIQARIWPLLVLPLLLIYIHTIVIPVEEARLREAQGELSGCPYKCQAVLDAAARSGGGWRDDAVAPPHRR